MPRTLAPKVSPAKRRGRPRSFDRETALHQAMMVFWRKGFEGASLADLTQAMGINPPSLYAAFGDKEGLFLEAMERYQKQWRTACPWTEEPTAEKSIRRLLTECATAYTDPATPRGCLVMMGVDTSASSTTRVQKALADKRTQARDRIRDRIQRGISDRELPSTTDALALASYFMAIVAGMSLQARDGASRKSLLAMVEDAMRAWPASTARRDRDAGRNQNKRAAVVPLG